jgi:ABC-2 type transport system ATP-binding protein
VELRKGMWQLIDSMRGRGVTIILTTHYIEEAEEMADRVGVINQGRLLMVDEKEAMMKRLGRTEAHIALAEPLAAIPDGLGRFPVEIEQGGMSLCYRGGDGTGKGKAEVAELTKALTAAGIDYTGIDVRESSLEDIFVALLGEKEAA